LTASVIAIAVVAKNRLFIPLYLALKPLKYNSFPNSL
jgi:hypothetical protein